MRLLAIFSLVLLSTIGWASPPSLDTIHLKNGDLIRGTIVEVIKGKSITIQTTQGEVRVIAFDSIESYGLGLDRSEPPPPPNPPPPPPPPPVIAPATSNSVGFSGKTVIVSFQSEKPGTELFMQFEGLSPPLNELGSRPFIAGGKSGGNYWYVCTSPCSERIPAGKYMFRARRDESFVTSTSVSLLDDASLKESIIHHDAETIHHSWNGPLLAIGSVSLVVSALCIPYWIYGISNDHSMKNFGFELAAGIVGIDALSLGITLLIMGHPRSDEHHAAFDEYRLEQIKVGVGPGGLQVAGLF